jgi:hypothetical protein
MTTEKFWQLIEQSRAAGDQLAALEAAVAALPPREMVAFEGLCWDMLSLSYHRSVWAVAAIIQPGCGDGAFEAVRAWMVLQGQEFFEQATAHPEKIAERVPADVFLLPWEKDGEELLRLVPRLYLQATGEDLPTLPRKVPYVLKGQRWTEYDLPELYPAVWRKYRKEG